MRSLKVFTPALAGIFVAKLPLLVVLPSATVVEPIPRKATSSRVNEICSEAPIELPAVHVSVIGPVTHVFCIVIIAKEEEKFYQ